MCHMIYHLNMLNSSKNIFNILRFQNHNIHHHMDILLLRWIYSEFLHKFSNQLQNLYKFYNCINMFSIFHRYLRIVHRGMGSLAQYLMLCFHHIHHNLQLFQNKNSKRCNKLYIRLFCQQYFQNIRLYSCKYFHLLILLYHRNIPNSNNTYLHKLSICSYNVYSLYHHFHINLQGNNNQKESRRLFHQHIRYNYQQYTHILHIIFHILHNLIHFHNSQKYMHNLLHMIYCQYMLQGHKYYHWCMKRIYSHIQYNLHQIFHRILFDNHNLVHFILFQQHKLSNFQVQFHKLYRHIDYSLNILHIQSRILHLHKDILEDCSICRQRIISIHHRMNMQHI